jgi:DNA-binding protein YbaB
MTTGFPDGESLLDPDAARAYLRDWQSRIDRTAADTQAMSDRLAQLRVTAADANGLAEVTIDSTGVLVGLHLSDRIQRFAPDAVSRAVLSAVREARLKAADRSREIITETLGSESVAARTLTERVARQLREPGGTDE